MMTKRTNRKSNGLQARELRIESLERRNLLSVDVVPACYTSLGDDQLQIIGTEGPDEVYVLMSPTRDSVLVFENGRVHDVRESFDHIYFEGRGGEDVFINATSKASIAHGGAGHDVLYGGLRENILVGGDGDDEIHGRGIVNTIWGDQVSDEGSRRDFPEGFVWGSEPGNDTIRGGDSVNAIYAGPGNDTIYGRGVVANIILGEEGNDWIEGDDGIDIIAGGAGNDILRGGPGDDVLYGNEGNDIILGEQGCDLLWGGDGRDLVIGGDGKDSLYGSEFDSTLTSPLLRGVVPGDILIDGTTDYDGNDEALLAILTEWCKPTSKESRIGNLQRGVYPLNDRTVYDDGHSDFFDTVGEGDWIVGVPISPLLRRF